MADTKYLDLIFKHSPFLTNQLKRHPDWSKYLENPPQEAPPDNRSALPSFMRLLREYKYKNFLFLAAHHLADDMDLEDFMSKWSLVADSATGAALGYAVQDVLKDKIFDLEMSVVALGKLGTNELNLSSDIDLIFIYNHDSPVGKGGPTNHELACKIATLTTKILSSITEDGFVFRVDNNLRPEGGSGPLANSLEAIIRYYEIWGQDWERLALLRARPIAGSKKIGDEFVKEVRPFSYSRSLDLNTLSKLKNMKEEMQKEALKKEGTLFDVKHSEGGIREAEFISQVFQMTYGGRYEDLRNRPTLSLYSILKKNALVTESQAEELKEAYRFLRRLEHMIQIVDERQTSLIPADDEALDLLAERMSLNHVGLLRRLDQHTSSVRNLFIKFFIPDYEKVEMEEAIKINIGTSATEEETIDSLAWFKTEETNKLKHLDRAKKIDIRELTRRLSLIAEVIVNEALNLATAALSSRYGIPTHKIGGLNRSAKFAVVGMGKLGGRELDYGSDLDIIFIFSHDGETDGGEPISNREYFTKLAQRICSLISLPTRYGRPYLIDTRLRPSGRAGTLVTSFGTFRRYHSEEAAVWERLALLKTRIIAGDLDLGEKIDALIFELLSQPVNQDFAMEEINRLRLRFQKEKSQEGNGRCDLKYGGGGIADIESLIQFLQLTKSKSKERKTNSFDVIDEIAESDLLDPSVSQDLKSAYEFYRNLLSKVRLASDHSTNIFQEDAPYSIELVKELGFDTKERCVETILDHRKKISKIYEEIMSPGK